MFFAKYNSSGQLIWAKMIDASNAWFFPGTMKVDAQGNVYVFGSVFTLNNLAQVDMNPGNGVANFPLVSPANPLFHGFLLKLNTNGEFQWVKENTGGGGNSTVIEIDASGSVYVASEFVGTVDFGAPQNVSFNTTARSLYLAKYAPSGDFIWAKHFENSVQGADNRRVSDLKISGTNMYFSGRYTGNIDLNPGTDLDTMNVGNTLSSFIVKLDTAGNYVYAKRFLGSTNSIRGLAIYGSNEIYAVGDFYGTVDFNPSAGTNNLTSNGGPDIGPDVFITKLNSAGDFQWAKSFGSTGDDQAYDSTIDNNGKLLVVGNYQDTVDFNPGIGIDEQISLGLTDAFLTRFDADGNYETSHVFGGSDGWDSAFGIFQDNTSNILIYGTNGSTDMDYTEVERGGPSGIGYMMKLSVETFASIENISTQTTFVVYPNPATTEFTIANAEIGTQITVIDMTGKAILTEKTSNTTHTINTHGLANGMYLVQVEYNGQTNQQKLIIQK